MERTMTDFDLKGEFLETARWRKEKAAEYPDDDRNQRAVELLEGLAADSESLSPDLVSALNDAAERYEKTRGDFDESFASEELRAIGFAWLPKSAEEVARHFVGAE